VSDKKEPIMRALGVASLVWKRYAQKNIHPHGVTINQFEVLRQLKKRGTLFPSDIAEMLFCDRSTATVVIRNMEKKGWVQRQIDKQDHRRFQVTLSSSGLEKYQEVPWDTPAFRQTRFQPTACFTKKEKDQLVSLLAKLNLHLDTIR
jgi:DNA-binding MarR family transcriptional regulator